MKKLLENTMVTWVWMCTVMVLLLTVLLVIGFGVTVISNHAGGAEHMELTRVLPTVLRQLLFSLGTAMWGVLMAIPLALALALLAVYLLPQRLGFWVGKFVYCYGAVPAVVLGYMALRYIIPHAGSVWSGLSLSLMLMAIPRLSSDFYTIFRKDDSLRLAAACLGIKPYQTILHLSFPAHRQELLRFSFGALARAFCEGVAVMMVLLGFEGEGDTLVTGTMRSLGVTTGNYELGVAMLQCAALLLPLLALYVIDHMVSRR